MATDIELVIKIPEKAYSYIKREWVEDDFDSPLNHVMNNVKNGTPLPKGHGDLIDKGIYKKWIETQDGDTIMPEYYLDALDAQETIIEAERSDKK